MPDANAQQPTLDEVKQEVMRRVGHISPFQDVRRDDVEEILKSLTSLERDHWAAQWCRYSVCCQLIF